MPATAIVFCHLRDGGSCRLPHPARSSYFTYLLPASASFLAALLELELGLEFELQLNLTYALGVHDGLRDGVEVEWVPKGPPNANHARAPRAWGQAARSLSSLAIPAMMYTVCGEARVGELHTGSRAASAPRIGLRERGWSATRSAARSQ